MIGRHEGNFSWQDSTAKSHSSQAPRPASARLAPSDSRKRARASSVSIWKKATGKSGPEREAWRNQTNDLDANTVLDTLCADLKKRGRIQGERPPNRELAELLVDEYVKFPPPSVQ